MKLSKIYCNKQEKFKPIIFEEGINFVLSEDHSVGKSTLFKLIDFCLFKSKPDFLKLDIFDDLEFYLELKIKDDLFITIKRSTFGRANDCIKISDKKGYYTNLEDDEFECKGGREKALEYFNNESGFMFSNIRHYISYFLRDQDNQSDVFRLNKFLRSLDIEYKPIVANLLGLDGEKIRKKYDLENQIEEYDAKIKRFDQDLGSYKTKNSILEEIDIYEKHLQENEKQYNEFDFYLSEHKISQELVDNIEQKISSLNSQRNSLKREIDYINNALTTEISLSIEDIDGLFKEMKVLFPNDLKNNYESVIEFNRQITKERKIIFEDNKKEFTNQLNEINSQLKELNLKRKKLLGVLNETDTMSKFKKLEKDIIEIKSSIKSHESKLEIFSKIDQLKNDMDANQETLKKIIKNQDSFTKNDFIETIKASVKMFGKIVFARDLAFSVGFNTKNNLEFHLKIANDKGFENFEDEGNTVKKLLCFVFSASLAYTYQKDHFFQFVAFDSPFDGDKNIWQNGVYDALKKLSKEGIQSLITTITDEIKNPDNLQEVKDKYVRRVLTEQDKLLGNF